MILDVGSRGCEGLLGVRRWKFRGCGVRVVRWRFGCSDSSLEHWKLENIGCCAIRDYL